MTALQLAEELNRDVSSINYQLRKIESIDFIDLIKVKFLHIEKRTTEYYIKINNL